MTNQTTQTQVLVPVDGSPAAKRAVGYAAKLAARLKARLSFAHVQPPLGSIVELKATDPEGEMMLASIAANYPDAALTTPKIVVGTDVACVICSTFPDAIVVVGSEHASRHLSDATQSVAEALVREAHQHPILVVGPRAEASLEGPVAIALDGSKVAEQALLAALAWSRRFATPLHLVQVVSPQGVSPASEPAPSSYLESVRAQLSAGAVASECYTIADDDPVAGLVGHLTAHGCSLVVMSTHARRGIEREALGSVTMGVIAASPCPVCAVHPDTPAQPELTPGSPSEHAQIAPRATKTP